MKVRFYAVEEKPNEALLAAMFAEGVRSLGDECDVVHAATYADPDPSVGLACTFALKGAAKKILDGYRAMGARTLLLDKGLTRASTGLGGSRGYFRLGLDEFMPLARIKRMMEEGVSPARWIATGVVPRRHHRPPDNGAIIYAGSSQKYSDFHGLGPAQEYAETICRRIGKQKTGRPIIYRPKPSWTEAVEIKGTLFSRPPQMLAPLLVGAYALVTHGSHAGIDAIVAGVPAIILGPGAARPVAAGTDVLALATQPLAFPSDEERFKWLAAIGWWQWTLEEMKSGQTWRFLREEMEKPVPIVLDPE